MLKHSAHTWVENWIGGMGRCRHEALALWITQRLFLQIFFLGGVTQGITEDKRTARAKVRAIST